MAGVAPPPDFAAFMRDMNKRIARLERHRHPNILDPVSENEVGAVGIKVCDGEATVVATGPDGVVRPVLHCGCGDPGDPGGGDPSFCGASMGTWWTEAIEGEYVNETVIRFMGDPYEIGYLAETVTEGQVFDTYFNDEDGLPETPGSVAIRFVIKTTAGSSGTLEFETGMEGESLTTAGEAIVTGAQEFIINAPGVTYADIQNGEYCRIRTTVTDGSVNIQQIKLRIWPTGGMRGGWATAPAWDYQMPPKINVAAIGNDSTYAESFVPSPGAAESVWDDVQAGAASNLSSLLGNSDELTATVFFYNVGVGPLAATSSTADIQSSQDNFNSDGFSTIGYDVLYIGPQPGSVIDYHPDITPVRHPDMVDEEEQSLFRTIGGGLLNSSPAGWDGPITLHIEQTVLARKYYSGSDTYEWKPFAEEFILTAGTVPNYPATRMSGPFPAVDGETPTPSSPDTVASEALGVLFGMDPDTGAADVGDVTYTPPDGVITAFEFKTPLPTTEFQNVDTEPGGPALHLSAVAGGGFRATITEASYTYEVPTSQYWSCSAS